LYVIDIFCIFVVSKKRNVEHKQNYKHS